MSYNITSPLSTPNHIIAMRSIVLNSLKYVQKYVYNNNNHPSKKVNWNFFPDNNDDIGIIYLAKLRHVY